jgi:hypothetical protein
MPDKAELAELRAKSDKRLKPPTLNAGEWSSNTVLGEFETVDDPKGLRVNWQVINGERRTALFSDLSTKKELADLRLELGWLLANGWRVEGLRLLWSIPGPKEAQVESAPFFKEERRWRQWAVGV